MVFSAEISLSMERPSLLHFSLNRWDQLNAVTQSATSLFSHSSETEPAEEESSSTVNPEDRVKSLMRIVKNMTISTIQIALIVEGPPNLLEQQFALSVSSFATNSELIVDKGGQHWNSHFKIQDFQLKINSGSNQSRHIVGPLTLNTGYKISWPAWNDQEFHSPLSRIQLHSGPLFVTVAPKQLAALKSFINFWTSLNEVKRKSISLAVRHRNNHIMMPS